MKRMTKDRKQNAPGSKRSRKQSSGLIEVITGPMYAGKSGELIRRLQRAVIAKQNTQVFNHARDSRYGRRCVASHDGIRIKSHSVHMAREVLDQIKPTAEVVGIDEVQLFDDTIVEVCETLASRGVRVIVAGLDLDHRGWPFTVVSHLMAVAESVDKISAICSICGRPAVRSQWISSTKIKTTIKVGGKDEYAARCRAHFRRPR